MNSSKSWGAVGVVDFDSKVIIYFCDGVHEPDGSINISIFVFQIELEIFAQFCELRDSFLFTDNLFL